MNCSISVHVYHGFHCSLYWIKQGVIKALNATAYVSKLAFDYLACCWRSRYDKEGIRGKVLKAAETRISRIESNEQKEVILVVAEKVNNITPVPIQTSFQKLEQRLSNVALKNKEHLETFFLEAVESNEESIIADILHKLLKSEGETEIFLQFLKLATEANCHYLDCLDDQGQTLRSKLKNKNFPVPNSEKKKNSEPKPPFLSENKQIILNILLTAATKSEKKAKDNFVLFLREALELKNKEIVAYILHYILNYCLSTASKEKTTDFIELMKIALDENPSYINSCNQDGEALFYAAYHRNAPFSICRFFKAHKANLPLTMLQDICLRYDFLDQIHRKNQKWIKALTEYALKVKDYECLTYGSDQEQSFMQILLAQLERNQHPPTAHERQARLKQEWLFFTCMRKLRKSIPAGEARTHIEAVWTKTREMKCLSPSSRPMKPIKTNKLPEIILHSPINQLIRMDQGLNVKGSQGTCARESIIILLAHLGTFLKSEKAMQESWNIVHPIFESFSFFESQIAKEIYRDYNTKTSINDLIKAGKLEEAQIKSNSIAEAILSKVDQDWDETTDRAEITEQILSLGWPKHAVGVGLRRIDSDAYEIIIANGGRGVRFNGIYDESTFQTTKVVRGNREALKSILTKMIYSSAREKKQKNDDTNFYKDLDTLLSVVDFNFSPGRLQPTGNCAIHNIKELIYYIIQRKEAAIQKGNLNQSHPYSTANRLSRHYHQRGKEQMEGNEFQDAASKIAFQNKSWEEIPSVPHYPHQLMVTLPFKQFILTFDETSRIKYSLDKNNNFIRVNHITNRCIFRDYQGKYFITDGPKTYELNDKLISGLTFQILD